MRPPRPIVAAASTALASLLLIAGGHAAGIPSARDLLRDVAAISPAEWDAVERGEPFAKILETDTRELAIVGAIRMRGTRDQLLQRYRNIADLKNSALVIDAGRFSAPPVPGDLQRAPFEEYNLDLRDCRAGECRTRLGADDVARFHREVNWQGPEWRQQSLSVWQRTLAAHAAAYAAQGRAALPVYVNREAPLQVSAELGVLLERFAFVAAYSPDLHAYMQTFGSRLPGGGEQSLYWTKEDFGVRPVIRISHQVLQKLQTPPVALVAINQVYADHYLDAALSVSVAIEGVDGSGRPSLHVVIVNRARTRSLTGFLRRFVRATVQGRSRDATRRILTSTKAALERN